MEPNMGLPLGIYTNHYGKGCGNNNKDCRGMDQVRRRCRRKRRRRRRRRSFC